MKKILLILVVVLVVVPVLVGGYFGLVPGVSAMFGSNKPRDLGVEASTADLESGNTKTGVELGTAIDGSLKGFVYEGGHEVEMSLSGAEITAMANNSRLRGNPFSQVQVRINKDGSGEASGYVDFGAAVEYAKALGFSSEQVDKALAKYPVPRTKLPFYVKLSSGSVHNDQISADVAKVELARVPVPGGIVEQAVPAALSFVESVYLSSDSIDIETLENREGQVYVKGVLPDRELVAE